MNNLAISTFNKLYSRVRSSLSSQQGASFTLKTFFDGSAVINVSVSHANKLVEYSCLVATEYNSDNELVGCRLVDDTRSKQFTRIEDCVSEIRAKVVRIRSYIGRIKN